MLSERRPPASVRTSGVSTRPEVISISPLFNGVTVGYQRPAAMFGPRLHRFDEGSKRWVWTMPFNCWSLFPPAMNIRPSMRWASPLQKMLKPVSTVTGVWVPVAGSHTVARV